MIKIEIPAHNKALAAAIGRALLEYGCDGLAPAVPETETEAEYSAQVTDILGAESEGVTVDEKEALNGITPETAPGSAFAADAIVDLDENGVRFDPNYCGQATEPFYGTGKRKGQWKKKRGVDDITYDEWYASTVQAPAIPGATDEPAPVSTAAAFGDTTTPTSEPAAERAAPKDSGEFMVWVSELQAAGHLTQTDLGNAYESAGLNVTDLFVQDADAAAANVASLYAILSAKVSA